MRLLSNPLFFPTNAHLVPGWGGGVGVYIDSCITLCYVCLDICNLCWFFLVCWIQLVVGFSWEVSRDRFYFRFTDDSMRELIFKKNLLHCLQSILRESLICSEIVSLWIWRSVFLFQHEQLLLLHPLETNWWVVSCPLSLLKGCLTFGLAMSVNCSLLHKICRLFSF